MTDEKYAVPLPDGMSISFDPSTPSGALFKFLKELDTMITEYEYEVEDEDGDIIDTAIHEPEIESYEIEIDYRCPSVYIGLFHTDMEHIRHDWWRIFFMMVRLKMKIASIHAYSNWDTHRKHYSYMLGFGEICHMRDIYPYPPVGGLDLSKNEDFDRFRWWFYWWEQPIPIIRSRKDHIGSLGDN